jgi:hypothetical protein
MYIPLVGHFFDLQYGLTIIGEAYENKKDILDHQLSWFGFAIIIILNGKQTNRGC